MILQRVKNRHQNEKGGLWAPIRAPSRGRLFTTG